MVLIASWSISVLRPPGARLVFVYRRAGFHQRIDDPPRLFHVVLAREERAIAHHCVSEDALVGVHLLGVGKLGPHQLGHLAFRLLPRGDHVGADGEGEAGADPEATVVRADVHAAIDRRRPAQAHHHLRGRDRQALSRPDVEGDALPAHGIDLEPQGDERLYLRVRRDAFLGPVAAELSAHHVLRPQRRDRLEDFHLLVADRLAVGPDRRLHRQVAQDLEEMVLHHVADGSRLVVERSPALDAEVLRHGELHALDVVPVPEGGQERIREPEEEHVMHRPLSQVVIDAEDGLLVEGAEQRPVEPLRRAQVVAERLLHDHARVLRAARSGQLLHHRPEQHGRDGEAMRGPLGLAQLRAERLERGRVLVVAVDVAQKAAQLLGRRVVEEAVLLEAVARAGAQLVDPPAGLGHPDHRNVEMAPLHHRLQRREDLLVSEVAGGAEEDQGVGVLAHLEPPPGFSRCPPKAKRMADSTRFSKSPSPRELNRW